jgi:hypothetical protein
MFMASESYDSNERIKTKCEILTSTEQTQKNKNIPTNTINLYVRGKAAPSVKMQHVHLRAVQSKNNYDTPRHISCFKRF